MGGGGGGSDPFLPQNPAQATCSTSGRGQWLLGQLLPAISLCASALTQGGTVREKQLVSGEALSSLRGTGAWMSSKSHLARNNNRYHGKNSNSS